MARNPRNRTAVRTLIALAALIACLFAGLGAAGLWGNPKAELTPQLGLDLAGGRQIVIEPLVADGEASAEQVNQAIDIIRNRIDGQGTSEAEVSRLGGSSIVVSIPGNPTAAQMEALGRSSQMRFRTVLTSAPAGPAFTPPETTESPTEGPEDGSADPTEAPEVIEENGDTSTDDETDEAESTEGAPRSGMEPNGSLSAGTPTEAPEDEAGDETGDEATATEEPGEALQPGQYGPSDLAWITPELQAEFDDVDCFDPEVARAADEASHGLPVVACSTGGLTKYILGPSELGGSHIADADFGLQMSQAGTPTGLVEVTLSMNAEGRQLFREITERLFGYASGTDQNRFAMVLDGQVLSAPGVNEPIRDGSASITGDFTMESAETLANQLRFGALPMSFEIQTSEQVSPTLGGEQLRLGLIAGAIGLILVFGFMLVQYRALGLVTVATLIIAGIMTYGVVTLLGWSNNLRLTMAGVTGLIMAIGIIADSFIVYFERIKDEVRAGRPLRYAVDTGWQRARRTILISDAVNLVAAGVLYWLSEASVRAFAFALGLITIIDLIVVFMFTNPMVSILANGKFFGEGHKWSGMDPERLGAKRSTYLGRGQFRPPEPARKRAHSREELEGGVV